MTPQTGIPGLRGWGNSILLIRALIPPTSQRRPMMGTEQKVAVITGASQGIGAALVNAYRDRNYRVVATARSIKPSSDDGVLAVPGDIADWKTAERVIAEGLARF